MKNYLLFILIFFSMALNAVPILTNVFIKNADSLYISFEILNLDAKFTKLDVACFNDSIEYKINADFESKILNEGMNDISIKKELLPQDFDLKRYKILPKLLYKGRIYYEMKKINGGSYPYSVDKKTMELVTVRDYYISKFEITNEQFAAFVNADGYEFQEYWEISSNLMSKEDIGWYYLSKYKMTLPHGWSFKENPFYKKAPSHFRYSPVTNIRWFEAYAFANWMECELPTFEQMQVAFVKSKVSGKGKFSGISEFKNGKYPLQKIRDGVSEWLESGVEPNSIACAGCNEMYLIENNSDYVLDKLSYAVKCPLFRAPFLGSRIVINTDRSRIK